MSRIERMEPTASINIADPLATGGLEGGDLLAWVDRWLGVLRNARVRVSLFSLYVPDAYADCALQAFSDQIGEAARVGRLPDGAIGIFYCAPRSGGQSRDASFERQVIHRALLALGECMPIAALQSIRGLALHRWAYEVDRAAELVAWDSRKPNPDRLQ